MKCLYGMCGEWPPCGGCCACMCGCLVEYEGGESCISVQRRLEEEAE